MLAPALLVGASLPITSYAGTTLGLHDLDPADSGSASSLLTASFQIGGALGVALVATNATGTAVETSGATTAYATAAAIPTLGLINLVRLTRADSPQTGPRQGR